MNLSLAAVREALRNGGATRLLAKPLVENDNTKQQLYLGKGFNALTWLPFSEVIADSSLKQPNFKAKVSLYWLAPSGQFEQAKHTQMILYPQYPEVRLSGFLLGCTAAPAVHLQPIPKAKRGPKNKWDGRVLFLGTTENGQILAALATRGSPASREFEELRASNVIEQSGVLYALPIDAASPRSIIDMRTSLLEVLREIKERDWTPSIRIYADGTTRPYRAMNGGGYTLEALLGIKPNGRSEPDYLGWEIKAYSSDRVTLMTPEPDGGFYGKNGVEAFLRKYGHPRSKDDSIYFTGLHRVGVRHESTGQLLTLEGYDAANQKIVDVNGGITLWDTDGNQSAVWTYPDLIAHWGRKHANAAYVKYQRREISGYQYQYLSPVLLGVGTEFNKYLQAMHSGMVIYDPAPKLSTASTGKSTVKARSQFRISVKHLSALYDQFDPHPF
jgi:hypothetical protein